MRPLSRRAAKRVSVYQWRKRFGGRNPGTRGLLRAMKRGAAKSNRQADGFEIRDQCQVPFPEADDTEGL